MRTNGSGRELGSYYDPNFFFTKQYHVYLFTYSNFSRNKKQKKMVTYYMNWIVFMYIFENLIQENIYILVFEFTNCDC